MEKIFMQNYGGTNKEYYGIFESGLLWQARSERVLSLSLAVKVYQSAAMILIVTVECTVVVIIVIIILLIILFPVMWT